VNANPGSGQDSRAGIPREHALKPLPFDPRKLRDLSETLIRSHYDNNYAGAVRNLNRVEQELTRLTKDSPPPLIGGLKEKELVFTNSKILHEHYFANLGGDGRPGEGIARRLAQTWGTQQRWEEEFRLSAQSLAGGSGWVLLTYNLQERLLRTYVSGNHSQALSFGVPLLVLDMYEHAFHIDFGAAAMKYVEAFFANLLWEEVERRLERAEKAASALGTVE